MASKWALFQDLVFRPGKGLILSGGLKLASGTYQKGYEFGKSDRIIFMPGDTAYVYNQLFPLAVPDGLVPGNTFTDREWGVYGQVKYTSPDGKLNLVAGARYDDNDLYGDTFNPRVGVVYRLGKKLLLKSNFGTAFQAPAPRNMYAGWGGLEVNADLKPDEISTVDLSLVSTGAKVSHDVTVFYNEVRNSIMQGENLPKKKMFGLEYKFNALLGAWGEVLRDIRLHANATFISSKYDENRVSAVTGRISDWVGGIAKTKANLMLDTDLPAGLHAHLRLNYVGKRPTTVSNPIPETDPYLLAHATVQWRRLLGGKLTLLLSVKNLFDRKVYHPGYDSADAGIDTSAPSLGWYSSLLPQPGRTFVAGARIDL